jgi:type VI secretion system protein ImpA
MANFFRRFFAMDFELLIRPLVSEHGQCGESMMFSSEFDEIQEARRFDDPSLSQGEWVTDIKEADWGRARRICEEVLANKSKDLRVAGWLVEALGRTQGLAGLTEGYTLLKQLCEKFWSDIHPLPEDGEMEQRIGNFDWLVNQTSRLIREIPLTCSPKGSFSSLDLESARSMARSIERNPGRTEEFAQASKISLEMFEAARKDTATVYFLNNMRDAELLKASMIALQMQLDRLMENSAPAFGGVFELLDDLYRNFRRYAGEAGGSKGESSVNIANGDAEGSEASHETGEVRLQGRASSAGPLRSREQAIQQLQDIAAFFKETEPHSPVAYLAEKAAKWGSMSLHEWLRAVVKDDAALLRMEELLGVEMPPSHDGA